MNKVAIRSAEDYITLQQFLKIVGEVPTGGYAKMYLHENDVQVNGEREQRRGRKLHLGDHVTIQGTTYEIGIE